jgi:hypothetical protein
LNEKREANIPGAKDLDELELKLLLYLGKEAPNSNRVYSLSRIAGTLGGTTVDLMSAITSLEGKGYIRSWRIAPEKSLLPGPLQLKDHAEFVLNQLLEVIVKIERLRDLQKETPKSVYAKVLSELLTQLDTATQRLVDLRGRFSTERDRIRTTIDDDNQRIAETKVRAAIGQMESSEAEKIIERYEREIRDLQSEISAVTHFQHLREESKEKPALSKRDIEKRLLEISNELELIWVRRQVGELAERRYAEEKLRLEGERDRVITSLGGLSRNSDPLEDLEGRVQALKRSNVVPDKLASQILSQFEALSEFAK